MGENYSHWRRRIRLNQCTTTFLSGVEEGADIEVGRSTVYHKDNSCGPSKLNCYEELSGAVIRLNNTTDKPDDPGSLSTVAADNLAKMRYLQSISRARAEMQSLVTLGERNQALRMIRDRASSLLQRLETYPRNAKERALARTLNRQRWARKSRAEKLYDLSRSVSETWLEYNFGWRQLVRDLDDAARSLAEVNTRSIARFIPVYGDGEETTTTKTTRKSFTGFQHLAWTIQKTSTVGIRYFGKLRVSPSNAQSMQTLGLSLNEYVPTVWELIPYSFLVDYFANVGEVLDGWSVNVGGLMWTQRTERRICLSETVNERNEVELADFPTTFISKSFTPSHHRWWNKTVLRDQYSGGFIPNFHFRIPGIGSSKWCNVAALAGKSRLASRVLLALLN